MKRILTLVLGIGIATAALAHTNVKNPTVKARMDGMTRLAAQAKSIGTGLKAGAAPGSIAQTAAKMRQEAAAIAGLFEAPEDDPVSEARSIIWANWRDFVAMSEALADAAAMVQGADTRAEQIAAFRAVGAACTACHKAYRE